MTFKVLGLIDSSTILFLEINVIISELLFVMMENNLLSKLPKKINTIQFTVINYIICSYEPVVISLVHILTKFN